ncbi:RND transporter, partial [Pseudomonas sp. GD04158]|nr:RND transporter [Pseudomonas sp. GD04158]
ALQARQRALEGRTALATAQVALYVALGGGWQAGGAQAADTPSEAGTVERER